MEARTTLVSDQTDGSLNAFFQNLFVFCADSVATCFSRDADKHCVPIGLCVSSASLSLLVCVLLVHQRSKNRTESPEETIIFFYCFLGNLCSTVGAILSRQLHIQILMGAFAGFVDAVNFMSSCAPLSLCWTSKTVMRQRMIRKRRRQHLLAVCILMVAAGGFFNSRVTQYAADRPLNSRRLLHVTLHDNTEMVGYILGLISFVIACTSRLPALCRVYRGQMLTWAYMFGLMLCSLAGVLYAAAILFYDTQFEFLMRVMPWLLSVISCVTLDLLVSLYSTILVIHVCKRGTRQHPVRLSADTKCLLGSSSLVTEDKAAMKKSRKQQVQSPTQTKNMTEMGPYMDVSIRPARTISLKEVILSEEVVDRFPDRTLRVIRVDSDCSSDTSYDSSPVSSDLEWDFEEANAQWRESTAKQQVGDEFSLQQWLKKPKAFNTCIMSGLQQILSGTEVGEGVSTVK